MEKHHFNSSSTLIKITYRYLCCVSANVLFMLPLKTGIDCAVFLEEVPREPGVQPRQLTPSWPGGYSMPWNAMPSAKPGGADWEEPTTAGDFDTGHHSSFLLFSSGSLSSLQLLLPFILFQLQNFCFLLNPGEEPRNPPRLSIHLSAVCQAFKDKDPPDELWEHNLGKRALFQLSISNTVSCPPLCKIICKEQIPRDGMSDKENSFLPSKVWGCSFPAAQLDLC